MCSAMHKCSYFVLKSVPPSLQVHVFSVGVVEAALTQFTVESNHFSVIVTDLKQTDRSSKIHNNKDILAVIKDDIMISFVTSST